MPPLNAAACEIFFFSLLTFFIVQLGLSLWPLDHMGFQLAQSVSTGRPRRIIWSESEDIVTHGIDLAQSFEIKMEQTT